MKKKGLEGNPIRPRARKIDARKALAWGLLLLAGGRAVHALEPATPLASYTRQLWMTENGLPQNTVQALVQSREGFLWLGTELGLVRFDGNSFQVFDRNSTPALPGSDIRSLAESADGTLWVRTDEGVARLSVDRFLIAKDLPQALIPEAAPENATLQQKLPSGEVAFASKNLLTIERNGRPLAHYAVGKELPGTRLQSLYADREGSLWVGTNNGLARLFGGKLERFPVTDPLATASILAILEDREGNLWVGTETGGLHILRDQRFRTIGLREGLSSDATTTVVEGRDGLLWVGTNDSGLNAFDPRNSKQSKSFTVRNGLLSDVILSLAAAPNGDLWVGTPDGLNRIRNGRIDSFTSADGLPDDFIRSLLIDADGSLWIGTRRGLTRWKPEGSLAAVRIETFTHANGLGSDLIGAMTRDASGALWVATFAGLSRLRNGQITNYTTANGLSSNVITALVSQENGRLLIGTQQHGWNLWDGHQFTPIQHNGLEQTTIHTILDDRLGHLWFATDNGIARCDCDGTKMQNAGCSHWIEFSVADGLHSRETATNSHPSAWRSHDDHLWFATPKGLVEIDPAHFPVNTIPPPVVVERFAVDDQPQSVSAEATRIPAGHVHFQFDYAGLSFTAPQKVRYRYTLEGFDRNWIEAGARHSAYYTMIPPGKYTFRVQAANNDGIWSSEGAALRFELRPRFYQTLWFYALLLALTVGLIALLLRLRLQRAEGEFRAVLGERNRIAREIHDTLAQGYVGISVQLEVLSELLIRNKIEAAAKHLNLTREFVREGLNEARQSIWALRSQDANETTLPVRLRRLVEAEDGHSFEASFSTFGAYRPLPAETEQEILRIAQEAIQNVKKHAAAQHLYLQIEYGPEAIALEVRDDGCGFDPNLDTPHGHYGLTGMRERTAAIGATLKVTSQPEAETGTTIRLELPALQNPKERA